MKKGTIALDVDGTITDEMHLIPDKVVSYFESLYRDGWQFIFATGRIFSFAMMALNKIHFPYYLVLQNGADTLSMPDEKRIDHAYFSMDVVKLLEELYVGQEGDFLIYSGYEKGDFCYYRPDRFSEEILCYLRGVEQLSAAPWKKVKDFDHLEQKKFPLIKCFGSKEELDDFDVKLREMPGIKTTLIQDPISGTYYLILITHYDADKGIAVQKLMQNLPRPLITAGDDNNDIPLLKAGDISIAIENAPTELKSIADIIAPPSPEHGIIQGLTQALNTL